MKFFVSAGHPMYKGAVGILDETVVDRAVVKELDLVLREMGHTVTVLNSESAKDYVEEVQVANSSSYDWYVDIHANCYSKESANGVETLVYADNKPEAHAISKNISALGFYNRGVKVRTDLYILKNTKAKALLVECFFISNKKDCDLYNKVGAKAIAIAIAEGLTGEKYKANTSNTTSDTQTPTTSYLVKITASVLNVRKGAGTNYAIATTIKKNEVYTIVEEKNGWGKLKSGAGWISLSYTSKL